MCSRETSVSVVLVARMLVNTIFRFESFDVRLYCTTVTTYNIQIKFNSNLVSVHVVRCLPSSALRYGGAIAANALPHMTVTVLTFGSGRSMGILIKTLSVVRETN